MTIISYFPWDFESPLSYYAFEYRTSNSNAQQSCFVFEKTSIQTCAQNLAILTEISKFCFSQSLRTYSVILSSSDNGCFFAANFRHWTYYLVLKVWAIETVVKWIILWTLLPSGMWCVACQVVSAVSKKRATYIFKVGNFSSQEENNTSIRNVHKHVRTQGITSHTEI